MKKTGKRLRRTREIKEDDDEEEVKKPVDDNMDVDAEEFKGSAAAVSTTPTTKKASTTKKLTKAADKPKVTREPQADVEVSTEPYRTAEEIKDLASASFDPIQDAPHHSG